jgi:preprotein translocase subunit SecG
VFEQLKKENKPSEANSSPKAQSRSIPVAVLLLFVVLLSAGSGIYAGASFFAQQASHVTVTTTIYTTTTSWTTSTVWSTVTSTVLGILTTVTYTTSTSTVTVTGTPTPVVVTVGGTSGPVGYPGSYAAAFPITLPSGTVTSIGINFYSSQSGNVRVALYSAGSGKPGSLLTQSVSTSLSGAGWHDVAVAPYSVTAGSYWVALIFDRNIWVYYSAASRSYYSKPFGAFDATWSATSTQDSYYQVNTRVTLS